MTTSALAELVCGAGRLQWLAVAGYRHQAATGGQHDEPCFLNLLRTKQRLPRRRSKTLPETVENVLRRKELKAEIKKVKKIDHGVTAKSKILASQIQEWQCPEAELWSDWLGTQPLYDEIASLDGRRQAPGTIAEFVAQESQYQPDINDGVRVNIAPLQKAGALARDVLADRDVDKAIADRAAWRADERRWVRRRSSAGRKLEGGSNTEICSHENEAAR